MATQTTAPEKTKHCRDNMLYAGVCVCVCVCVDVGHHSICMTAAISSMPKGSEPKGIDIPFHKSLNHTQKRKMF